MTPHFALHEFTDSETATRLGIDNTPTSAIRMNLYRVAEGLEQVRHLLGDAPVTITSGYRCPALNHEAGGVADSAHVKGLAADFVCPAYGDPSAIVQRLAASHLYFDQLIQEHAGGKVWVHFGLSESRYRREVLVYDGERYVTYQ